MFKTKIVALAFINVIALAAVAAQSTRRGTTSRPSTAKPAATPTPAAAVPQPTPVPAANITATTLAVFGDQTISTSDIETQVNQIILKDPDPYLHDYYTDPNKAIREARQRAVDARVASMLIAAEAKKKGKTPDEILASEVSSRIPQPTDQEIKAAYDANRDQLGGAELESVRTELANFIRNQRSQDLYAALVSRLRMTHVVTKSADVNAPNLAPGTVLVAVDGEPLRVDPINERMKAYAYKLEMRVYAARRQVLDRRINDLLVVAEANKRKVGPEEIVRTEITEKLKTPTEAEVAKFYEDNKARIKGDLAEARTAIASYLQDEQQAKLEVALAEKLRAAGKVQVLLKEPEAPVMNVNLASGASRGDVNAAVTIVEFTDFQCSACGGMYPIVEEVLKSYGNRVHFVIRNFPLTSVHPNAFNAAQAAEAAKAQGKFWEYIDILFKNQTTLETESLKKYATQVGLDRKRFDTEFDSGKYEPTVRKDMEEGEGYGIDSTPTFFINGVILTEYSAAGLKSAIEKAFAKAGKRP
ncbi:MAG TPA: thioredoxin domain-containing protein [Pyrinomonadaceae bacterium]|nr:thioredoxin domain-containing protein [Pyrinomonadaceae bacterium]